VQHPSHYRILTLFGEPIFGFCALSTVGADCARLAVGERFIPVDERDRELADEVTEDDCAIAGHARRRLRTT